MLNAIKTKKKKDKLQYHHFKERTHIFIYRLDIKTILPSLNPYRKGVEN